MLTIEKYNIFLDCLFTLDDNYTRSDDYSVYAKNHAKYNRIQFMTREYSCLKELKCIWDSLRKEKDENAIYLINNNFKRCQDIIIESLSLLEEPCSV